MSPVKEARGAGAAGPAGLLAAQLLHPALSLLLLVTGELQAALAAAAACQALVVLVGHSAALLKQELLCQLLLQSLQHHCDDVKTCM